MGLADSIVAGNPKPKKPKPVGIGAAATGIAAGVSAAASGGGAQPRGLSSAGSAAGSVAGAALAPITPSSSGQKSSLLPGPVRLVQAVVSQLSPQAATYAVPSVTAGLRSGVNPSVVLAAVGASSKRASKIDPSAVAADLAELGFKDDPIKAVRAWAPKGTDPGELLDGAKRFAAVDKIANQLRAPDANGDQAGPLVAAAQKAEQRLSRAAAKTIAGEVPDYVPEPYREPIAKAAAKHGISAELLAAQLQQESGYAEDVIRGTRVSSAGAQGIAQFMPGTAATYGVDPLDPDSAIDGAARHMRDLLDANGGRVDLALAAYNAGQGAVDNATDRPDGLPNIPETLNYVDTILGNVKGDPTAAAKPKPIPKPLVRRAETLLGSARTAKLAAGKTPKGLAPAAAKAQAGSGPGKLQTSELYHDPGTNLRDGQPTGAIGGHGSHVHFASNDPISVLRVAKKAQELGMLQGGVGENPAFDVIDAQHAPEGYHYREMEMPSSKRGERLIRKTGAEGDALGQALDIAGTPEQMMELNQWIAERSGAPTSPDTGTLTTSGGAIGTSAGTSFAGTSSGGSGPLAAAAAGGTSGRRGARPTPALVDIAGGTGLGAAAPMAQAPMPGGTGQIGPLEAALLKRRSTIGR